MCSMIVSIRCMLLGRGVDQKGIGRFQDHDLGAVRRRASAVLVMTAGVAWAGPAGEILAALVGGSGRLADRLQLLELAGDVLGVRRA